MAVEDDWDRDAGDRRARTHGLARPEAKRHAVVDIEGHRGDRGPGAVSRTLERVARHRRVIVHSARISLDRPGGGDPPQHRRCGQHKTKSISVSLHDISPPTVAAKRIAPQRSRYLVEIKFFLDLSQETTPGV